MDGSEVTALELAAVDLADPARVGVPVTAAKAMISKEMGEERTAAFEDSRMRKNRKMNRQVAKIAKTEQLREMLGEGDVIERVSELIAEREVLIAERAALMDAAITAAVERVVRVPAALALVEELVRAREPQTLVEINAVVAAVVESEAVKSLLRAELQQAMGPSQRRPVRREGESGGYFEF